MTSAVVNVLLPESIAPMTLPEKPDDTVVLHIPWDMQALGDLLDRLQTLGQQQEWSLPLLHKATLVIEELVVNALSYGAQTPETGMLEVRVQQQADHLCIDVYDNGCAFDPFSLSEPNLDADLDSRRVGGLGVFLVKTLSQTYRYERQDGLNHVQLHMTLD